MHDIPDLSREELRKFGIVTGAILVGLLGLLLPVLRGHSLPLWPWILVLPLWGLSVVSPGSLKSIYQGWMRIGLVMGFVNTRIILGIIFYGLVLPTGLIMRLFRHDPMAKGFDRQLNTYRVPSKQRPKASMEKPY